MLSYNVETLVKLTGKLKRKAVYSVSLFGSIKPCENGNIDI